MSHVTCLMSNAYVDPWDMLNNFCFLVYAQMSLFMGENGNAFLAPYTSGDCSNRPDERATDWGVSEPMTNDHSIDYSIQQGQDH